MAKNVRAQRVFWERLRAAHERHKRDETVGHWLNERGNGAGKGSVPNDWRDFYSGGYLRASDVPEEGMDVTIVRIEPKTFREGERPKLVAQLVETDKEFVINPRHCERLQGKFGTGWPAGWVGRSFKIYNDKTVVYNGIAGGIRIR